MIGLDAHLLASLLLRDDATQHAQARALVQANAQLTAPVTVMLELVWVLEANDCTSAEIVHGLNLLLGLPNFVPQEREALQRALQGYASGQDFADALHLALSNNSVQFATFDKGFAKKAAKLAVKPEVLKV